MDFNTVYIKGYNKHYSISRCGEIISLERKKQNHSKLQKIKETRLKFRKSIGGYDIVNLSLKGVRKTFYVHKLVANAFIPNPLNKPEINHINGIKDDNRIENLEWVTPSENMQHSYDIGLNNSISLRKKVVMFSLNDEPLLWFDSIKEASSMCKINKDSISKCCRGKHKTAGGYKWEYKTD